MMRAAAVVAGFLSIAAAEAADLGKRPTPPAPVVVAPSWTGFYVGAGVGFQATDNSWTTTRLFNVTNQALFPASPNASLDTTSFRASVYAGYNYQLAPQFVVGAEGDIGYRFDPIKRFAGTPGVNPGFAADQLQVGGDFDGSLRLRAGFLVTPSIMLYGTGGVAFQNTKYRYSCNGTATSWCIAPNGGSTNETDIGWTVGGGVEAMLTANLLLRAEYRYADFGSKSVLYIPGTPVDTIGGRIELATHTAQIGLAYKF